MNYREKKKHYAELQGVSHYDADLKLLRETDPGNKILKRRLTKNPSAQKELLWQLLSVGVDAKVIVANRRELAKPATKETTAAPQKKRPAAKKKPAAKRKPAAKKKAPAKKAAPVKKETPSAKKSKSTQTSDGQA